MSTDSSNKAVDSNQGPVVPKISWNPWVAVVFVIAVYYVSQIISGLVVSIYPILEHWSQAQSNAWLEKSVWAQFFYILIAEALTLGAIYLFLRAQKSSFKSIGFRRPRLSDVGHGLLILPLYFVSYIIVVTIVQKLIPGLNINQAQQLGFTNAAGVGTLILTFISLVILPPIVEETMVRGFLYTSLKKSMPQIGAALVTSAIFASAHLQAGSGAPLLWIAAIDTFVLSLFLIYLREKTGSLWASMTLHALKNGIAFASIFIFHLG